MANPQFVQELSQLLHQVVFGDHTLLKNVTSQLNGTYFTKPDCLVALLDISKSSPEWQIRQLANIELKKRIPKFWNDLNDDIKAYIKKSVLEMVLIESESAPRNALTRAVSIIGSKELPDNKWPDLLPFIHKICSSHEEVQREIGYCMLNSLFDDISYIFEPHLNDLFRLFQLSIRDQCKNVRLYTLQILEKVGQLVETKEHMDMFSDLVPAMVEVIQGCLNDGDEASACKGFEVFDNLLILEAPILSKHIIPLIEFFTQVAQNTQYDESVRIMALTVLMWCAIYKRSKIQKHKLANPLIQAIMTIGCEEEPEDRDEDSPARSAFKVLNALATNLPPQQVFPPTMEIILQFMTNPHPGHRKASMLAFAVMIEGCSENIRARINDLLPLVLAGLRDPEITVRRSACIALGALADELEHEISSHHDTLLPVMFDLMNDTNEDVVKQSCNALDAILETIGIDIIKYLPSLMEKLYHLFDHAPMTVKATVVAAIGSAAHAASKEFVPYFEATMNRLRIALNLTQGEDEITLRAVSTDTIGTLAEAVGKELFRPFLQDVLELALNGIQLEDVRLKESCYCLFALISRVFGKEVSPCLPRIMPALIQTFETEENFMNNNEESFDTEIEEEDLDDKFKVNTAVADEKEVAADAVSEIFEYTKEDFLPYLDNILNHLIKLTAYYSDTVRKASVAALFNFLCTFSGLFSPQDWTPGLPLVVPVHEKVQAMSDTILNTIVNTLADEDDKMVVVQICQEMCKSLKVVGPAVVANYLEPIAKFCLDVYEKKALCQDDDEDDETLDEEEQAQQDSLLMGGISDLIASLAMAVGPSFNTFFQAFYPHIKKLFKPTRPLSDRSMAIGCLAEITSGLGQAIDPYTEELLTLFVSAVSDPEDEVKSNAAYGIGMLCQSTTHDLSSQYLNILNVLAPLFQKGLLPNLNDNACGAVSRMILKNPAAVPLDSVLPILIECLPLQSDMQENEPVTRALILLYQNQNPAIVPFIAKVKEFFSHISSQENAQLKGSTNQTVQQLLQTMA